LNLRDALELSSKRLAVARFSFHDSPLNGEFHAMGGDDGSIFVAETREDGKPRLSDMKIITSLPDMFQHVLLRYDKWEPRLPRHPLEALADADALRTIDNLFHTLWSKAHDAPDYDKSEWMTLQRFLEHHGSHTTPIDKFQV
jgi:hypothetical protein